MLHGMIEKQRNTAKIKRGPSSWCSLALAKRSQSDLFGFIKYPNSSSIGINSMVLPGINTFFFFFSVHVFVCGNLRESTS